MRNLSLGGLSPRAAALLVAVGVVGLALVAYLLVVSPKRSEAAALERDIAEARRQLVVQRRLARTEAQRTAQLTVAQGALLRAMPDRLEMPRVVLDLDRLARRTGVRLDSITPQAPVPATGYQIVPIDVIVQGRFDGLRNFLARVRQAARLRGAPRPGAGRLYSVETLEISEGETKFPQLRTTLRINTFTFTGGAARAGGSASAGTAPGQGAETAAGPSS